MSKEKYDRVIFLDIDGVLNYNRSKVVKGFYVMDAGCVQRLRTIVEEVGAVIVISSSWRTFYEKPHEHILWAFDDAGWSDPPIIDHTPVIWDAEPSRRGREIQQWLDNNPTESYLIIDDENDMLPSQQHLLIKPNFMKGGLLDKHLDEIRHIWKNEKTT